MKKLFLFLSILSLIPLTLFFYSLHFLHQQLNFHATEDTTTSPLAQTVQTQYLIKSDGRRLAYWYFPVKNPKAVVILIHGYSNPGGKAQMIGHVAYLQKAGYSTVVPDLQSFGQSDGAKITLGVTEWQDISALYDYLKTLPENKDKKIGFLGHSMGAVTAIVTAGITQKGDFVIASVPFIDFNSFFAYRLSSNRFAKIIYPFVRLAGYFELGFNYRRFTPVELISHIHVPLLIFSAAHDESVSGADSSKLFQMADQPKEYWQADSGHDIFATQSNQFQDHVLTFLKKYAP